MLQQNAGAAKGAILTGPGPARHPSGMSFRPPRPPKAPENPLAALEYEFLQERASALGRLGRQLEAALAALAAFDADNGPPAALADADRAARGALVARAGVALWHFIVQREALGLRDGARVLRDYRVPAEIANRMGAGPPGQTGA